MKSIFFFFFFIPPSLGLEIPSSSTWEATPVLHQPHDSRATEDRILILWSAAVHSVGSTTRYEVQVRWPEATAEYDWDLYPRPSAEGVLTSEAEWVTAWSDFTPVYSGLGRQFEFRFSEQVVEGLANQRVFSFRVRAVCDLDPSCISDWSNTVITHLTLEGRKERFSIELIGTGRNNAQLSQIIVDGTPIFSRADIVGLVMAVFDRRDFSLVSLDTYDTFTNKAEATRLALDVRAQDPNMFVAIVSSGSWEWNFTPNAAAALEQIGAFYVGQWSRVFSVTSLQFNPYADIAETASQDSFGHPYALLGYAGLGMGNGWESLQLNTGHYLALGKAEEAIIRLSVYYNYVLGRYVIGSAMSGTLLSSSYFSQSQLPQVGTVHAPIPLSRTIPAAFQIHPIDTYAPYVGNLWNQVEYIMETNETVFLPDYNTTNYGFEIIISLWLPAPLISNDPRQGNQLMTEEERVWGGPTARVSGISSNPLPGAVLVDPTRVCQTALAMRLQSTSPNRCTDYDDPDLAAEAPLMQYGVGVWPMVCSVLREGCEEWDPDEVEFSIIDQPVLGTPEVLVDTW